MDTEKTDRISGIVAGVIFLALSASMFTVIELSVDHYYGYYSWPPKTPSQSGIFIIAIEYFFAFGTLALAILCFVKPKLAIEIIQYLPQG